MLTSVVRISEQACRVTLQRYLLSRFVYEIKEVDLRDLCCLFENQLWIEQKVMEDLNFYEKFGKIFEILSQILKEINFNQEFTDRALRRFQKRIQDQLGTVLYPRRNYASVKQRYSGLYTLGEPKPLGRQKTTLPPKRRIGKGYTDKGTLRNKALDGSPSWQEVAAHRGPLYKNGVPNESEPFSDTVKRLDRVLLSTQFFAQENSHQGYPGSTTKVLKGK